MFKVNEELLARAAERIARNPNIFCVLGGSCSGKSAVLKVLTREAVCEGYDMDAAIFGDYLSRYGEAHPANRAWLFAPNPFDWSLSLSWPEFDGVNRAANAEYLDLLARDVEGRCSPLVIDGGFTYPSLLVKAIPADRLVCLRTDESRRVKTWQTADHKKGMADLILTLPKPQEKWRNFLLFDRMLTETIHAECAACGVKIIDRAPADLPERTARQLAQHFGLTGKLPRGI